jgi:hypothetical protein
MAIIGYVWSLRWANPYTTPPDGMPRLRAEVFFPVGHPNFKQCPTELSSQRVLGSPWVITWSPVSAPIKPLSQEALASVRRKRLARRVKAKYPLLADQIIAEELAKKPDYYAGITRCDLEAAREEVLAREKEWHERVAATPGVIHWYDKEA